MNAAFEPIPPEPHHLDTPACLPNHLPQAALTEKQRIASWVEQRSDPAERQIFDASISTLVLQMISSGETESRAEQVVCRCLECGVTASGIKQLHLIPEVANTLGCTISQALELFPAFLPKREISGTDAINHETVHMVCRLCGDPTLLTWSLNLISDLALRGVSNRLFTYVPNLISAMYRETLLGTYPENSVLEAREIIAGSCQTLSRLDRKAQDQLAQMFGRALADQQSIPEFFDALKELGESLTYITTNEVEHYWHCVASVFANRFDPPPVLAHFIQWSMQVISNQPQSQNSRTAKVSWDNHQLSRGLSWITKTVECQGAKYLPCEYLPVTGDYYQAESISSYDELLLSAFIPEREPWVAHPPLGDKSRSMIFKALHRTLLTDAPAERVHEIIRFAQTATKERYADSQVADFCQAQHRSTFRHYAPMLDDYLLEHLIESPEDAWAVDETRDIYLLDLSVHGKMSRAAIRAFSAIIGHDTALGGSAFKTLRNIAFSDLSGRLSATEPWSQVTPVLEHLLPARLTFSGWNIFHLSESAFWTPAQWKNTTRILAVCERHARARDLDPASRWLLSEFALSTVFELFSFEAPAHAFRAFERLLGQNDLSQNKLESIARRELISYSVALKRLELSIHPDRKSTTDFAGVLEALKTVEHKRIRNDGFPVHDHNRTQAEENLASQMHRETMRTFQLTYGISHGFAAQRFPCQRVLGDPAQSARFVEECRGTWTALQSNALDLFPGSGYIFSGIIPDCLISQSGDQRGRPMLQQRHFSYLSEPLSNFSEARFVFLRGVIIVIPPAAPETQIEGSPYSLLIYNDHFSNSALEPGHLVPTAVVLSQLNDLRKGHDERHPAQPFKFFEIDHLRSLAIRRGLNCLNLCWGSNLNTGLQNSFPPQSAPFFLWERDRTSFNLDCYKHEHKQSRLQELDREDRGKFLESLQRAHHEVYRAFAHCFGYLQTFQVLQAAWNRGFNNGIKMPEHQEYRDSRLLEAAQLPADWASILSEPPLRQLRMAIEYHLAYQQGWSESDIPVLASCDAETYAAGEIQPLLNPVTMEIFLENGRHPSSIKELPLDKMLQHWNELTDRVSMAERHRRRFQDLRWVQSSYLRKGSL